MCIRDRYKSYKFELQMVREILKDGHLEFELFYRRWCADNEVDLDKLNKDNQSKVESIFIKQEKGIVKLESPPEKNTDKHKKVYREIARKIHPDKLKTSDPRFWEYTNSFKAVNEAMDKEKWGDLFEVVEKYDIWLTEYTEACDDIQQSITDTKQLIEAEKKSYSWALYECKDDELCKEKVVRSFLLHLFGWKS